MRIVELRTCDSRGLPTVPVSPELAMDNAHLPNSHPNVTPDWRPYPFKTTQLLDAIKTSKVEATGDCRYAGSVPRDWCSSCKSNCATKGNILCLRVINSWSNNSSAWRLLYFSTASSSDPVFPGPVCREGTRRTP
jgi:hypothetical protein